MIRLIAIFFIIISSSSWASAQRVVVRDAEDKTPLPKAEVSNESGITIFTNREGVFELDTFKNDVKIYVRYNGYQLKGIMKKDISKKNPTIKLNPSALHLNTAFVTPKGAKTTSDPAQQIEVITARQMQFGNPMTSASVLENSGLVSVQRSQLGGGSPQMRGFEANKVLLVLDGVRMNNAIYRSGHVQNAITVDANVLEKTEVYFGPSSVLYGSDALGGTVHFKTKRPILSQSSENITQVNMMGRVASASEERTFHVDLMLGTKKWGFLSSFTHADFGDLRMGRNRRHGYEDWGKIPFYIAHEDGVDVLRRNGNQNIQKFTGYSQLDLLQKVIYKASNRTQLNVNFQYSNSSDIPRFDRLNDTQNEGLKWAEWYYGPQRRTLTSASLELSDRKYFTDGTITAAYQRINEDRTDRRFGRTARFTNEEDVKVYSLNADFSLEAENSVTWFYGAEAVLNDVVSNAFEENIITGEKNNAITRYPNGGSRYNTFALYGSRNKVISKKTDYTLGVRYSHTLANSKVLENEFYSLPYSNIKINDGALTASAGIVHKASKNWKIAGGIATGFKSPNVDDYGKIFEKDGFVVVPNADLKSEYIYSADVTLERNLLDKKLKISATPYFTYLTNAIVRRDTILSGSNQFFIEGDFATVQTNKNASEATIYGLSSQVRYLISTHWLASATYNYTYGQDLTDDVAMAHIAPEFGKVSIEYQKGRVKAEAYTMYASQKKLDRYGPGTTDNLIEAVIIGTPAWKTFNLRTSTKISKTVVLQIAVENILDTHYKAFASGLSAPGRNVIMSLKTVF